MTKTYPIFITKTSIPLPTVRCCAPGCGDKIKPSGNPVQDWMWSIIWNDNTQTYVEQGCENWFENGHPDLPGTGFDIKIKEYKISNYEEYLFLDQEFERLETSGNLTSVVEDDLTDRLSRLWWELTDDERSKICSHSSLSVNNSFAKKHQGSKNNSERI